jgi:sugar-specific transcriptional regulator TrmB
MVVNNSIARLMELGFSEYEARAYTALVGAGTATAYEAAKLAGISTSKIYEVLAKLVEKGLALVSEDGGTRRYVPIDPEEFVEERRSRITSTLDSLKGDLAALRRGPEVSYIWNIGSREQLMEKAARIIGGAEKGVLVSGWMEELEALTAVIGEKHGEGVPVASVVFGGGRGLPGQVYYHPIEDTLYNERGGRGLTVVADSREALMGTVFAKGDVEGAWSVNRGFVLLAEDYIKHDVYIMKIVERFDDQLIRRFGPGYCRLRDVFSDREAE